MLVAFTAKIIHCTIPLGYGVIKIGFFNVFFVKIIITPTRLLYVVPELLMSNRVLRKYDLDGEKALRVLFRDDDGSKIHSNNVSKYLIDRTVGDYLRRGVNVAGEMAPCFVST